MSPSKPRQSACQEFQDPAFIVTERNRHKLQNKLLSIYQLMFDRLGDRHWWPAETVEEVIIGAILVQNISWRNVTTALRRLQDRGLLSLDALAKANPPDIEECITSTLYYRMKAKKLQAFARTVETQYNGSVETLLKEPMPQLRGRLLSIYGIGPETADDIVLYAANQATFVVDTYTKRIFYRLGYVSEQISYEKFRDWFMDILPRDVSLFNNYHALLDAIGHSFCTRNRPKCGECPLSDVCQYHTMAAGSAVQVK